MEEKTAQQRIEELEREVGELKERNGSLLEREKMQKEAIRIAVMQTANVLKGIERQISAPIATLDKVLRDVEVYMLAVDMTADTLFQLNGEIIARPSIVRPTKAMNEAQK